MLEHLVDLADVPTFGGQALPTAQAAEDPNAPPEAPRIFDIGDYAVRANKTAHPEAVVRTKSTDAA
jgi:hypothetical protein